MSASEVGLTMIVVGQLLAYWVLHGQSMAGRRLVREQHSALLELEDVRLAATRLRSAMRSRDEWGVEREALDAALLLAHEQRRTRVPVPKDGGKP